MIDRHAGDAGDQALKKITLDEMFKAASNARWAIAGGVMLCVSSLIVNAMAIAILSHATRILKGS